MGAPKTLPANFANWDSPSGPPSTLPADFSQWDSAAAPASAISPDESTLTKVGRGATIGVAEGLGVKPATTPGEVITGTLKQVGQGIGGLIGETWRNNANIGAVAGPGPQLAATALDVVPTFIDKTATSLEQGGREAYQAFKRKDYETGAEKTAQTLTSAALLRTPRRALKSGEFETVGTLRKAAREKAASVVGPTNVSIAGEKIPALVEEAHPETRAGSVQGGLKRAGIGERRFTKFTQEQQAKVKAVIRKTAQQTSGAIAPMAQEPGEAVGQAATATFNKATPMYNALDEAMATVPDTMNEVSKLTKQAIARAEKLGYKVTEGGGEEVTISGRKFTPQTDPVGWENLKAQGLVPNTAGQPLTTYMKVRSALLDMQRGARDDATRYALGNEIKSMTANVEKALDGTPLADNFKEANRLWAKGYALRDVADVLKEKTKGTPEPLQASGLSKVPTKIQGGSLVERLNALHQDGILERAFSPQEVQNLRAAADILDRASEPAGKGFKIGYGPHSTIYRNIIGLPFIPLVHAMTRLEGVEALRAGLIARDAGQAAQAFDRLARIVGTAGASTSSQINNRRDALTALGK
jgi:hypothetical protein